MKKPMVRQPNKKAKILKSEIIYEGKAFGVRRDELIEPTGVRTVREVVTHPGSVVILPVLPDGRIVMVRQYRHACRQYLWELVAGRMERGENPKKGGQRELLEETGYRARKWRKLAEFFPSPGFLSEKMTIYLATGLTAGEATPMEDERIETRWFTAKQLDDMIRAGKILDAKTNIGFLRWTRYFAGK